MDNKNNGLTTKDREKEKEVDREEDGEMTSAKQEQHGTRTARNRNVWRLHEKGYILHWMNTA